MCELGGNDYCIREASGFPLSTCAIMERFPNVAFLA